MVGDLICPVCSSVESWALISQSSCQSLTSSPLFLGHHVVSQEGLAGSWRVPGRSRRVLEGVLGEYVKCLQFVQLLK